MEELMIGGKQKKTNGNIEKNNHIISYGYVYLAFFEVHLSIDENKIY